MGRKNSPLGFVVALFDVLGFEFRLQKFGLDEIFNRYNNIVQLVKKNSEKNRTLFEKLNITAPLLVADGPPVIFYEINAIYSSDTIMLWSNLAYKLVQDKSIELLKKNANHSAYGYLSNSVPLMPFLSMCAEIICTSIEIDLPLRGALAMGDAVFNEDDLIFLGDPIVDAARLEKEQNCIGLSICNSFVEQPDHHKFFLPYSKHFKDDFNKPHKEYALNWPLFWRNSRTEEIESIINKMAEENNNHQYYSNTLNFIKYSKTYKHT
jgi:hypothetical protein